MNAHRYAARSPGAIIRVKLVGVLSAHVALCAAASLAQAGMSQQLEQLLIAENWPEASKLLENVSGGADRLNASSFDRLAVASGCGHGVTAQGEAARREGCFRGEVTDTRCCQAKGFHGRCGAARVTVLPDSCRTAAQDGWSRLRCSRDSLLVVGAAVVKLTVEHQGQSEGEE